MPYFSVRSPGANQYMYLEDTLETKLSLRMYLIMEEGKKVHITMAYNMDEAMCQVDEMSGMDGKLVPLVAIKVKDVINLIKPFCKKDKIKKIVVVGEEKKDKNLHQFVNELKLSCDTFVKNKKDKKVLNEIIGRLEYVSKNNTNA